MAGQQGNPGRLNQSGKKVSMPLPKHILLPFLVAYLLLLSGLGKALLFPAPAAETLRVDRVIPAGEKGALLSGAGFDQSTQAFLSLDVGNRHLLRNTLPTWGEGGELVRVGAFAYLANGKRGLVVLSLADPLRPRIVGSVPLPGLARTVVVHDHIAYVGCGKQGLAVVDIRESTDPRLVAMLPGLTAAHGMTVVGDHLYVTIFSIDVEPALAVLDISQPHYPRPQGRLPLSGQPTRVVAVGEHLCVAAGRAGLYLLTLDAAGLPGIATQLALPGQSVGLAGAGHYVYVGSTTGGLLTVVDLGTAVPKIVASLTVPGYINVLLIENERLYALGSSSGGHVLDLSEPWQPRLTGYFDGPRATMGIAAVGETVYLVGRKEGLQVVDLSTPAGLQVAGQLVFDQPVLAIALQPGLVFVTTSGGALYVIDRASPQQPQVIGSFPLQATCRLLVADQGLLFAYIPKYGLEIIDVSDPRQPRLAAHYPHPLPAASNPGALAVDGPLTLLASDDKLLFLDVSNPEQPILSAVMTMPERILKLVVQGDLICATTVDGRLLLIDRNRRQLRGSLALPVRQLSDLALAGPMAVAVSKNDGLLSIDLTDPDAPRLLAMAPLALPPDRVTLQGSTAYVTNQQGGVQLVDLTDLSRPGPDKHIPNLNALAVDGEHLYLAASVGLLILPLPQELAITVNTPQELSFDLPPVSISGRYTLRLDNGRQTVTLPGALRLTAGKDLFADR
jgi:hypothetical protein